MRIRTLTSAAIGVVALAATIPLGTPATAAAPSPSNCTITGTSGADRLVGTSGADVICGLGGNDILIGNGGRDTLVGGRGSDRLNGSSGADMIMGNDGRDILIGGTQADVLIGGTGVDQITAGTTGDTCAPDTADPVDGTCAVDTTGPEISDVTYPSVIDAGETFTVTWRVTDASGIDAPGAGPDGSIGPNTRAAFGGPPGFLPWCDFLAEPTRISGNGTDGVYEASCAFPTTIPNTTYSVMLAASDVFGNPLPGYSQSFYFDVRNGSDDVNVPAISNVDTDKETYAPGDEVTITFRATDETGVAGVIPWAFGPNGRLTDNSGKLWLTFGLATLVSGDANDGTYTITLQLSDNAVAGAYDLWFSARDTAENRAFFSVGANFNVA